MNELKPWQRVPKNGCKVCDGPPSRIVSAGVGEWRWRPGSRQLFDCPEYIWCLACERHADLITGEYCDIHGVAGNWGLQPPWGYWLASLWWRPWNRIIGFWR